MQFTIKEIQSKILYTAKYLDEFCRDNDIHFYLMGGSALGAMRHKGFIPWDDDLDVFMPVKDYERFLNIFESKGDTNRFYLQKGNTEEWPLFMSQLCLKGTTMISDQFINNKRQHHNVFVDIMCLYSTPDNEFQRRLQYYDAQILRVNALSKLGQRKKNIIKYIALAVSRIIVNPLTKKHLVRFLYSFENGNSIQVGHFFGRARYPRTNFLREYMGDGTPRYVEFEDTVLPVFQNVEEYLVARFGGKWMEMPDQKTRDLYPRHGGFVDLNNDYTTYLVDGKWNLPSIE